MELRETNTVDQIRNIVNVYRHDHRTGLPRGVPGTMLALTENDSSQDKADKEDNNHTKEGIGETNTNSISTFGNNGKGHNPDELYVAPKGGKGQGKTGYGQCWECGEMGHPRRECPKFFARMNGNNGDVVALKGGGKNGTGGKGKGKGGKGKWNGTGNPYYKYNSYNYQSLGKAVGKKKD